jgi:hypothetical protein
MGEKTTVDLSTTAVRQLAKIAKDLGDRLAEIVTATHVAPPAPPAAPCPGMHGEPWLRDSGNGNGELVAFLDDARALRWVQADQLDAVPAGWRPVLLGEPVKR